MSTIDEKEELAVEDFLSKWQFSSRALEQKSSIIREILKFTVRPGVISFAGGLPAPELFPVEELKEACHEVLDEFGANSLQYSLTMGIPPLRQFLAERISRKARIPLDENNVMITGGAQQALDLIGRTFLEPGSVVITERPTYLGALQAFNFYGAKYVSIDMDEDGLHTDQLEDKVKRHNPRLIYVVPNFQNPSGITLSLQRRRELVEIAKKYNVPIVDDNPYGELRYRGEHVPSIKSIGEDHVIQVGTFSKIISPGLRIGWLAANRQVMSTFERMKQATDLHTNTFSQYVVLKFARQGLLDKHITKLIEAYSRRREVMVKSMEESFPDGVKWTDPDGGLFLWVTLPEKLDSAELLKRAVEQNVAYVPGAPFFPEDDGRSTMRLNFSNASEEMIAEGIARLGRVFKKAIASG